MGHEMVGTQHWLWALFSIDEKAKPQIRNWLEMNIGVSKEMVLETFKQLTPEFQLTDEPRAQVKYESLRLVKAV